MNYEWALPEEGTFTLMEAMSDFLHLSYFLRVPYLTELEREHRKGGKPTLLLKRGEQL